MGWVVAWRGLGSFGREGVSLHLDLDGPGAKHTPGIFCRYPGRRDALGPGPSHPPYSQRLAVADYGPSAVEDFYTNMG